MNATRSKAPNGVLIVGYGNELRADDGIGPFVADQFRRRALPEVQALSLHQLLPEVAAQLAEVQQVFFVDASMYQGDKQPGVRVSQIQPAWADAPWGTSHAGHPAALLALCLMLFGRCPQAWLVTVDGEQFDGEFGLTTLARQRADEAVRQIAQRISVAQR